MGVVRKLKYALIQRVIQNAVERAFEETVMKNWRTTILGVFGILSALGAAGTALLDGDASTTIDLALLAGVLAAAWGNIVSKDAKANK